MKSRLTKKISKAKSNQAKLRKEITRVKRAIAKVESQGIIVPKKIKDLTIEPKRVTDSRLKKLESVTPKTLQPKKTGRSAKNAITPNRAEFKKEAKKLRRRIADLEKRGFTVDDSVKSLLDEPSRVTKKRLEKMKEMKGTELYKNAAFMNPETGEIISGVEGRKYERSQAAKKGWERKKFTKTEFYESVIMNIKVQLDSRYLESKERSPKYSQKVLTSIDEIIEMIDRMIDLYGLEAVAEALLNVTVPIPSVEELYHGKIRAYTNDFVNALHDSGVISDEERAKYYKKVEEEEEWPDVV